jgi:hypothetical protein
MTDTPNPVILDRAKPIFQLLFQVSPALPESVDSDIKPIWIAFDVPPRRSHNGCRTTTQEEIDAWRTSITTHHHRPLGRRKDMARNGKMGDEMTTYGHQRGRRHPGVPRLLPRKD